MSRTSRHRRQRPRRTRRTMALVVGGVLVLAALGIGAFVLTSSSPADALAPGTNNVRGLATAPVEVESWSDFQCPHCKTFAVGVARQVKETFGPSGTARIVFRHMAFLGQESIQAAAAAECAAEQGQFWPYHDRLFAEQRGRGAGTYSKPNLKRFGAELGLEPASFNRCVDDDLAVARVRAETQMGEQKGVRSTPTVFVNGQKIEGVPNWETLRRMIEQATALVPAPATSLR